MTSHNAKLQHRRPRASTRISLTDAAAQLGVTREHLSRVLHGHRESRSLLKRFHALEAEAAKESPRSKPLYAQP